MANNTKKVTPPSIRQFVVEMSPLVVLAGEVLVSTFVFIVIGLTALGLQEFTHEIETAGLGSFYVAMLTGVEYILFTMDMLLYVLMLLFSFVKNVGEFIKNVLEFVKNMKAYLKTV
jgi:hypothetical protein